MIIFYSAKPTGFVASPPESLVAGDTVTFELTFHSNPEAKDIQFTLYDLEGPVNMTVNASTLTRGEEDIVEERYTFSPVVRVSEYFFRVNTLGSSMNDVTQFRTILDPPSSRILVIGL